MSSAAKVGVFMLVILAILGYFVLKIEDLNLGRHGEVRKVTAIFDSVAGLEKGAGVRVAGVRIGKVDTIKVRPDGKAQVTMEIDDPDVQLHSNASAKVANLGLLGEKYVELDPGNQAAPLVTQKGIVLRGSEPASIDDVTNQISAIATDVKAITESLRHVMAGPEGQQRLDDIVENVRAITAETRALIAANRSNVDATLANAREISAQLRVEIPKLAESIDRVANSIGGTVTENRKDVREIVENLRGLSGELRTTADNLNAITGQVKSGEGTVGKLIYSNEAHDRLTSALNSVEGGVNELKNTLGRASRIQLDLGMKAGYYAGLKHDEPPIGTQADSTSNSRSEVMVRINPNPERNRFYNIVLADDPRGKRSDQTYEYVITDPNGQTHTIQQQQSKFTRDFVVSAQAGWMLGDTTVRLGIFDNTGGAGLDYKWNDRLRFTGEAFDFGGRLNEKPHLRAFADYVLRREQPRTPQLFLSTGVDDPLNHRGAFTFGGGIRWRDDDLKYLLSSVPIGK